MIEMKWTEIKMSKTKNGFRFSPNLSIGDIGPKNKIGLFKLIAIFLFKFRKTYEIFLSQTKGSVFLDVL